MANYLSKEVGKEIGERELTAYSFAKFVDNVGIDKLYIGGE